MDKALIIPRLRELGIFLLYWAGAVVVTCVLYEYLIPLMLNQAVPSSIIIPHNTRGAALFLGLTGLLFGMMAWCLMHETATPPLNIKYRYRAIIVVAFWLIASFGLQIVLPRSDLTGSLGFGGIVCVYFCMFIYLHNSRTRALIQRNLRGRLAGELLDAILVFAEKDFNSAKYNTHTYTDLIEVPMTYLNKIHNSDGWVSLNEKQFFIGSLKTFSEVYLKNMQGINRNYLLIVTHTILLTGDNFNEVHVQNFIDDLKK